MSDLEEINLLMPENSYEEYAKESKRLSDEKGKNPRKLE